MQIINQEQVNPCLTSYEVEITKAEFNSSIDKAYKEIAKEVKIDGFRKGKAPRVFLQNIYKIDSEPVVETASESYVSDHFDEIVKMFEKEPYGQVSYDVVSSDLSGEDGNIVIKFNVPGEPIVTLGEYKGIELTKYVKTVSDEDIQGEIDNLVARQTKVEPVLDRSIAEDDTVFVELVDTLDADVVSTETFIVDGKLPEVDSVLIGMELGDDKSDVSIAFPDDYINPSLAGKSGVYNLKIKNIYSSNQPEVNDEWVVEIFKDAPVEEPVDTVEKLKAYMRDNMQKQIDSSFDNMFKNSLLDKIVELSTIEYPEAMLEPRIKGKFEQFSNYLKQQNMKIDDYMKLYQITPEMMYNEFKQTEDVSLRRTLVGAKIVEVEGLEPTEEEIKDAIVKKAEEKNSTYEAFKEMVDKNPYFEGMVKDEIVNVKFMDFLIANAKVTEEEYDETKMTADKLSESDVE